MLSNHSLKDLDKQVVGLKSQLKHVPVGGPEFTQGTAQLRALGEAARKAGQAIARAGKGYGPTF